jgi:hypothetical protein
VRAVKRSRAAPPLAPALDRAALLAAVRARAGDLSQCPLPSGEPLRAPVRLRLGRGGEVEQVALGARLPDALAGCLRDRLRRWRLEGVSLPQPQDVEVTLALHAGAP